MIVKTNEMKGMIMMSQQDLPTLFYSGKSNSAVPIISESELQKLQLNHGLKFPKGLQLEGLNLIGKDNYFYWMYSKVIFSKSILKRRKSNDLL